MPFRAPPTTANGRRHGKRVVGARPLPRERLIRGRADPWAGRGVRRHVGAILLQSFSGVIAQIKAQTAPRNNQLWKIDCATYTCYASRGKLGESGWTASVSFKSEGMNEESDQRQFQSPPMNEESEAMRCQSLESNQQDERARAFPERPQFSLRRKVRRARAALAQILSALLFPFSLAFWMATLIILAMFASGLEAD